LSYLKILHSDGVLVNVVDLELAELNRAFRFSVGLELSTLLLDGLSGGSLNGCGGLTTSVVGLLRSGGLFVLFIKITVRSILVREGSPAVVIN
jgi:hypothetical protein